MRRRRLVSVLVVVAVLVAGCVPGGGEGSEMDSMEADAALRQLIAETARGSLGDREIRLDETLLSSCDPGVPPKADVPLDPW